MYGSADRIWKAQNYSTATRCWIMQIYHICMHCTVLVCEGGDNPSISPFKFLLNKTQIFPHGIVDSSFHGRLSALIIPVFINYKYIKYWNWPAQCGDDYWIKEKLHIQQLNNLRYVPMSCPSSSLQSGHAHSLPQWYGVWGPLGGQTHPRL